MSIPKSNFEKNKYAKKLRIYLLIGINVKIKYVKNTDVVTILNSYISIIIGRSFLHYPEKVGFRD